jgi:hypothetical protein
MQVDITGQVFGHENKDFFKVLVQEIALIKIQTNFKNSETIKSL